MGDEVNPTSRPRRLRPLLALVATLLAGVVLGIVADRVYLRVAQRAPDERLIGDWVGEAGDLSFRSDGTYESAPVVTVTASGGVTKNKLPPYTAQYRWVDRETIQMYVPILIDGWLTYKLVFEGDQLSLLGDKGRVERYTRKKG